MKKRVALLFFSLLVIGVKAQISGSNFNSKFIEANQLMEEKLWNRASNIWSQLILEDQFNGNVNYKLGYCLLETANRKLESLKYLELAVEAGISKNYDPFDPSEKKAPIDSKYYLSRALHLDYQMEKAIISYTQLLADIPSKHRLTPLAKRQIEMCNQAIFQVTNPQNYTISNVGSTINSNYNDYSPVISLNEKTLFFTSRRVRMDSTNINITDDDTGENKEDIYVSYKDQDNEWQSPELLNINTDGHAASISVSPDAQTLYIYFDQGGNGDIYKSQLVGESWTTPEPMGSDINSPAWETHITVSSDEKTLFFISDRENGYGGRDIYQCVKLPTNEWSKALNVGPSVNTPYDEDAVFLSADGKTLYFSSNGHKSMGDFDIFFSSLGDDGEWSKPENIGYPLNTTDADVFFYPTADNNRAYYSSRKEGGLGLKDIYAIDMPDSEIGSDLSVLKGYVYPAEGEKLPENCLVVVTNKNTGEVTEYRVRQRDGSYVAILPPCMAYEIEYFVKDELVEEEFINVPCEAGYKTIDREVFLLPVQLEKEDLNQATAAEGTPCDDNIAKLQEQIDLLTKKLLKKNVSQAESPISSTFDEAKAEAKYTRYFVYDFNDFGLQESKFEEFSNNLKKIIDIKGEAEILVEASASYVPSSRFSNNNKLAESRAAKAKKQIIEAAKRRGVDINKITFAKPLARVQGPAYKNDAKENRATYELYQYIKLSAK